jgi:hypothetical protein
LQVVALLVQSAVNVVAVVPPLGGDTNAEHVGFTATVLESHEVVPPGPVAISVTLCRPEASVLEVEPLQATAP